MKLHPNVEAAVEFERARESLDAGQTLNALAHLEKSLSLHDNPSLKSYLGYCMAKERGHVTKGLELCQQSMLAEPEASVHYLNLGKIHLHAGNKEEALRVLREGVAKDDNEEIKRLLNQIGMRKPPVFPSLSRDNPLNIYLGKLFSRLGLR